MDTASFGSFDDEMEVEIEWNDASAENSTNAHDSSTSAGRKTVPCGECGTVCRDAFRLAQHAEGHALADGWQCAVCGVRFNREARKRNRHERQVHAFERHNADLLRREAVRISKAQLAELINVGFKLADVQRDAEPSLHSGEQQEATAAELRAHTPAKTPQRVCKNTCPECGLLQPRADGAAAANNAWQCPRCGVHFEFVAGAPKQEPDAPEEDGVREEDLAIPKALLAEVFAGAPLADRTPARRVHDDDAARFDEELRSVEFRTDEARAHAHVSQSSKRLLRNQCAECGLMINSMLHSLATEFPAATGNFPQHLADKYKGGDYKLVGVWTHRVEETLWVLDARFVPQIGTGVLGGCDKELCEVVVDVVPLYSWAYTTVQSLAFLVDGFFYKGERYVADFAHVDTGFPPYRRAGLPFHALHCINMNIEDQTIGFSPVVQWTAEAHE
ncbi:hypothetical protein M3Y99_00122000 [Aphelenchoides fujianensis]|nr:hypothetical protein M3Y99_00122000 [Aphelenchoides fujianensis]